MTIKSVFGYIALVLGSVLILVLLLQVVKAVIAISYVFETSEPSSYTFHIGVFIGTLVSWAIEILLVILLFRFGIKAIKEPAAHEDEPDE